MQRLIFVGLGLWVLVMVAVGGVLVGARWGTAAPQPSAANVLTACAGPCFAGIVPGQTTLDEALRLLDAHPYITDVGRDTDGLARERVTWTYSEAAPPGFSNAAPSELRYGSADRVVQYISVYLNLPMWELAAANAYGPTDHLRADGVQGTLLLSFIWRRGIYATAYSAPTCPVRGRGVLDVRLQRMEFWTSSVEIEPMRAPFPWRECP